MKLLIDTNILLDVLMKREPYDKSSSIIWKLCETHKAQGYVSVLTFMNIVYVMRKSLTNDKIAEVFKALSLIFTFESLTEADLRVALEMKGKDYEDAVQIQTAYRVGADYIITRNVKDFKESSVLAYTPLDFIQRLELDDL